jgi:hypothetical protein
VYLPCTLHGLPGDLRDHSRDALDADTMLNVLLERAEAAIKGHPGGRKRNAALRGRSETDRKTPGYSPGSTVHSPGHQGLGGRDFQLTRERVARERNLKALPGQSGEGMWDAGIEPSFMSDGSNGVIAHPLRVKSLGKACWNPWASPPKRR